MQYSFSYLTCRGGKYRWRTMLYSDFHRMLQSSDPKLVIKASRLMRAWGIDGMLDWIEYLNSL